MFDIFNLDVLVSPASDFADLEAANEQRDRQSDHNYESEQAKAVHERQHARLPRH